MAIDDLITGSLVDEVSGGKLLRLFGQRAGRANGVVRW
ncbi:hypothetical protein IFHNHDMJ_00774 [Synechococcus sp. CBW1107]|jgi:hypothetical protein|nr:hypothetical protein IFHNHDMJ_00774 [Synechococcus sp. CBW1107]